MAIYKTKKRIIKPQVLLLFHAILAALIVEGVKYLFPEIGIKWEITPSNLLLLSLFLLLSVTSFLILDVYKFRIVNKALLKINPRFYEEREFGKWFDYYEKHL